MPFEKDPDEIGVLWQKQGAKGPYMSGVINGEHVVVFAINSTSNKAPNWRVLKAKQKEDVERPMHNANATPDSDIPF